MTLSIDTPIREKAYAYLTRVQNNLPLQSQGLGEAKAALYAEFTGNNQEFFNRHWAGAGDGTTGCNGFTGTYAKYLGGGYVGGFSMDTEAPKAWVASDGENTPGYGDICLKANRGHVFVILDTDPLTTIQAGFDGSGHKEWIGDYQPGFDVIGVGRSGTFDPAAVLGWLDIDRLVPFKATVPYWVLGWWQVTWDEDVYYYYFGVDWQVYWTYRMPRSVTEICSNIPSDGGVGRFTVNNSLNIAWRSGSKEQFWYGGDSWPTRFWGNHNGEGVLQFDRL
jgi:hypothetical protein